MDTEQFRIWGKVMIDYVADYWNISNRTPLPNVKPGFMKNMLPAEAPEKGEDWEKIIADIEPCILQTSTHWHHPRFFAYYPSALGYPAILGDILGDGIGCIGFSWLSSPACTELELIVLDWLAKMIRLPEFFLNSHPGPGTGMIQSTASDCVLVAMLAARAKALKAISDEEEKYATMGRLVAYCSDQAHCSVERAALLAAIKIRLLPADEEFSLRSSTLENAVKEDVEKGLRPILLCAALGTTSSCGFDDLTELGPICEKYGMWLHVDAAYAGGAFICPEYRHYMQGCEFVDSFNLNAHKLLATNFDCSPFWFSSQYEYLPVGTHTIEIPGVSRVSMSYRMRDSTEVKQAFQVDPLYLKHAHENDCLDLRHYQIPLGRRFRALKLWFTLRSFGVNGLQEHVRGPCRLAKNFEALLREDDRFEIMAPVQLSLVCFRLRGPDETTQKLLALLNEDRRIFLVPCNLRRKFVLRFSIGPSSTTSEDIKLAWKIIGDMTKIALRDVRG